MWLAIYKPYELIDGRTMWERVQVDDLSKAPFTYLKLQVAQELRSWNLDARRSQQIFSRNGLWIRVLVPSSKPSRFFFREELHIWEDEVLPAWEQRL